MKLLVDEMPLFPDDDCPFCQREWDFVDDVWVNYCKLTNDKCDLNEKECSCLKKQEQNTNES